MAIKLGKRWPIMDRRQLPKIPRGAVPIIGQKKYSEKHVLELGGVKLFPPLDPQTGRGVDPAWIMTFASVAGLSNEGRAVLAAFGFEMMAFLAKDHEIIGKKYDMVMVAMLDDGGVQITKSMPPAPPAQG